MAWLAIDLGNRKVFLDAGWGAFNAGLANDPPVAEVGQRAVFLQQRIKLSKLLSCR